MFSHFYLTSSHLIPLHLNQCPLIFSHLLYDSTVRQTLLHPSHVLCCKTQRFVHPLSLKDAFRAWLPSKRECWRCDNKAFMRDFLQKLKVEDVKICENEAFVRDFPENESWQSLLWQSLVWQSLPWQSLQWPPKICNMKVYPLVI